MPKTISFSPPDITDAEISEVVDTLKSGWITTGPKTKRFEAELAAYCGVEKVVCVNSATAGMELVLRLFGIGPGDEVITTPYTYAATANVIIHVGAKPVFVDIKPGEFNIDPEKIEKAVTKRTKAVMPVDYGGFPCDYQEIKTVLERKKSFYRPAKGTLQEELDRPLVLSDAAHSFGAAYQGRKMGSAADFTVFSFHAVKNLTTAEGGAICFQSLKKTTADEIYKRLQLWSLHGQSKDALSKMQAGGWKYQIEIPGYKHNMTDLQAAIGLAQLKRFDSELTPKRKKLHQIYMRELSGDSRLILPAFETSEKVPNYHLFPLRIKGADEELRGWVIQMLAERGISANVHFIPVVMHPAYMKLGYHIEDYPETYAMYQNEITLPLYPALSEDDVVDICVYLKKILDERE